MDDLAEKRVYADREGTRRLLVAAATGLFVVSVSGERVGEFGLARRGSASDIAVAPERATDDGPRLAVATDEDVLLAEAPDVDTLVASDFGPAVAVTFDDDHPIAASPDGRLAVHEEGGWTTVAELSAALTALDGDLVGTADGVRRLVDGELRPAGLKGVNDVARAGGIPLAATANGLYALGNGWMDVLEGDVRLVAGASDGRAHAATAEAFFERVDGDWRAVDGPAEEPVVAVAYGERTYALTRTGDLLIERGDGWGAHPLGLGEVRAAAVLE